MMTTSLIKSRPMPVRDRSVSEIIAAARAQQAPTQPRGSAMAALCLAMLSGGLLWVSFAPVDWSPLAWLAPVPLLALVRLETPTRRMYAACYAGGLTFLLPALQWMRLGDPAMYLAWWALAAYVAAYFPLSVGLMRVAVHRWKVALVVAAPVVWVGLEFVRAHLMTGFAWYFLGHTQYRWLELIQISDVFGAYGVSFVMMASAAAVTDLIPTEWFRRWGLAVIPPSVADEPDGPLITTRPERLPDGVTPVRAWPVFVAAALVAAAWIYGAVRRSQAEFEPGPRVALIQGNFAASLRLRQDDLSPQYLTHMKLTALAVREQPDVIVWPESMFRWPLTTAPADLTDEELHKRTPRLTPAFWRNTDVRDTLTVESQKSNAALIWGIECVDLDGRSIRQCNSAVFVKPDLGLSGRYDKLHLVPFGEYIPFVKTFPWVASFTPFPSDFGLTPGQQPALFEHLSWRMSPVICFEDTVPHLVRGIVSRLTDGDTGKPLDVLVNLSNDGWFHGSSGLDQHLITAAFRAVECRTPLVRAVNTGISAIIDGDGAIREPEVLIDGDTHEPTTYRDPKTGRWRRQINAAVVHTVPLDSRRSLYVRYGDWFAWTCSAATCFFAVTSWRRRAASTTR